MTTDPLERFLASGHAVSRHPAVAGAKYEYRPFETSERDVRYLEFRFPYPKMTVCLPYAQLIEINCEWRLGKSIMLLFARSPHPVFVRMDGVGLQDLYDGLKLMRIAAVAEFDPMEHIAPVGSDANCLIKKIELTRSPPAPQQPSVGVGGPRK